MAMAHLSQNSDLLAAPEPEPVVCPERGQEVFSCALAELWRIRLGSILENLVGPWGRPMPGKP